MGKKNSSPEGAHVARARLYANVKSFWVSRDARRDLWPSILNRPVETHREEGSKSPKVSGKLEVVAWILAILLVLVLIGIGLAWVGIIPNWKT